MVRRVFGLAVLGASPASEEESVINQVLLGGRISSEPRIQQGTAGAVMELELELERPPREWSPGGRCTVGVRATTGSTRLGEAWEKYLSKGRAVLVHGYLQAKDGALSVVGERVEFLESGLVSSSLEGLMKSPGRRVVA